MLSSKPLFFFRQQAGFTLLELIVTIIIIGILSVNVLPRFLGSDGYEEYTYRDRAIGVLRNIQLRAMQQDSTVCNEVALDSKHIGIPDGNACSASAPSFSANYGDAGQNATFELAIDDGHDVAISHNQGSGAFRFSFDKLGRPSATGSFCVGGCVITFSGLDSLTIVIEAEGYIHAGN
ncbi:prepilin-type N-terminal cleavage/methylation domain-containing protein [Thalassotalea euphylliae]|uniref:prepilin-type N-terminal cleavage/methylation domain-containing protein n=1 Tax=Thalassotalea euphylliae TaxID=1655234 RepID=UPI00363BBDF1